MQTDIFDSNTTATSELALELCVQSTDLHTDWKRVSLLANYLAEYVAYEFPQRERAENLLSTITNEVLEAVVNLAPEQTELVLCCRLSGEGLILDVKHNVRGELRSDYLIFVEKLGDDQDDQSYLQMLTSEKRPEAYFNQLGLTMLEHDFDIRFTLSVEEESNQFCTHVDILDEVLSQ